MKNLIMHQEKLHVDGIDENEAENEENYVDVQNKKEENQVI